MKTVFQALVSLALAFLALQADAQTSTNGKMSIKLFAIRERDLDAKVYHKVLDGNDELCALVKLVTSAKGFAFETGMLGITKIVEKTGETWIYLPYGARFFTLKHNQLGVIRDYEFATGKLQGGVVYQMVLTSHGGGPPLPQYGSISSTPTGADVYIDGVRKGATPVENLSLIAGDHQVKITKPLYHDFTTTLSVSEDEKFAPSYTLKPNFGSLTIASTPESGATILLDGRTLRHTTPYTLPQLALGTHTIRLQLAMYDIAERTFTIADGEHRDISLELRPLFGRLSISATPPSSTIWINGEQKGAGSWSGRLATGLHGISIERNQYYTANKRFDMATGADQTLTFELKPITGTIAVVTNPTEAQVTVDGVSKGSSPLYIRNLIIGTHQVAITKAGYATITKTIRVAEKQTHELNATLVSHRTIRLTSTPTGASVYLDDSYQGITPMDIAVAYDGQSHTLALKKADYTTNTQTINAASTPSSLAVVMEGLVIDGVAYKTIRIGNQVWMVENLHLDMGDSWCYNYNSANCNTYGRLYTWEAAKRAASRVPSWHLPTDAEWQQLERHLGMSRSDADGRGYRNSGDVGRKLKSTNGWDYDGNGTNYSGFNALPGGERDTNGDFNHKGYIAYFWTAATSSSSSAWLRFLSFNDSGVLRGDNNEGDGYSVRLVRD